MCGIVGYIGSHPATGLLLKGLRRLEYRGYDSVGVAMHSSPRGLQIVKTPGRVERLSALLQDQLDKESRTIPDKNLSFVGIGHSRWATHGPATYENAHPHIGGDGEITLVHNGIIENHDTLRRFLERKGYRFQSATDTEVVAHLIHWHIVRGGLRGDRADLASQAVRAERFANATWDERLAAVRRTLDELDGSYALVILFRDMPDRLLATRHGSPLIIGAADDGHMIGSDPHAISFHAHRVLRLEDQEMAVIQADSLQLLDEHLQVVRHEMQDCVDIADPAEDATDGYPHQTLQEIHQQPGTLSRVLAAGESASRRLSAGPLAQLPTRVLIAACGTSWHAGLYGKYLIEELAGIPVDVEYASELRYRSRPRQDGTLMIVVSQSGETADTVGALRDFLPQRQPTLAICNVGTSTLAQEADGAWLLLAGQERGVAATKSFVNQCAIFAQLAMEWGRRKASLNGHAKLLADDLARLPRAVAQVLDLSTKIQSLAHEMIDCERFLFVGRGYDVPTALEGALKLKEISYVSAEGFPAGELKHGPLALVDEQSWTVALATPGRTYEKTLSNLQEIRARNGRIVAIAARGDERVAQIADEVIEVPTIDECLQPIVNIVPLQLLSYYIATARGCDVDRPRNLAKSVTVE